MIKTTPRDYQIDGAKFMIKRKTAIMAAKTGKGKTLMILADIHHVVKDKKTFGVVFCPVKAYVNVWEQETVKHTDMKLIRLPDAIKKARELGSMDFLLDYDILLVKYPDINADNFSFLQKAIPGRITVYDECLSGSEKILLSNGKTETIGRIVVHNMQVEVMSLNVHTGIVEPKKVTGWFKNSPKEVYRIKTKRMTRQSCLRASENHIVYTTEGKKKICELQVGDKLLNNDKGLSQYQKEMILGTLLGDSSADVTSTGRTRLSFIHSHKYLDYITLKRDVLNTIVGTDIKYEEGTENDFGNGYYTFSTLSTFILTDLVKDLYVGKKKTITRKYLDMLTPLSILYWFIDDGYITKDDQTIGLSTHGFSLEEQNIIIQYFIEKWGVLFLTVVEKRTKEITYSLRANKEGSSIFLNIINYYFEWDGVSKYSSIKYKNLEHTSTILNSTFEDEIISIEKPNWGKVPMYDIEVEDNHNFFANGVLVSNCHKLKNPEAKLTRLLSNLTREALTKWGMTATAIGNSIMDLHGLMQFIDPTVLGTEWQFKNKYCVMEEKVIGWITRFGRKMPDTRKVVVGFQNLDELKEIMSEYLWSIDSDLEVKFNEIDYTLTEYENDSYVYAAHGVLKEDPKGFAQRLPDIQRVTDGSYDRDGKLTQGFRSSKYLRYLDKIKELLVKGESLILFAEYLDSFNMLKKLLKEDLPMVPVYTLEKGVDVIQQFPCVVLSSMSGTESLNLKFANHVLCFSIPFSVQGFIQLAGRITRMDSEFLDDLNVYLPICKETIDYYKYVYLMENAALINSVLGKDANLPIKQLEESKQKNVQNLRKDILWRYKERPKNNRNK